MFCLSYENLSLCMFLLDRLLFMYIIQCLEAVVDYDEIARMLGMVECSLLPCFLILGTANC